MSRDRERSRHSYRSSDHHNRSESSRSSSGHRRHHNHHHHHHHHHSSSSHHRNHSSHVQHQPSPIPPDNYILQHFEQPVAVAPEQSYFSSSPPSLLPHPNCVNTNPMTKLTSSPFPVQPSSLHKDTSLPPELMSNLAKNALDRLQLPAHQITETGIIPNLPYYELPAGLMVPLVPLNRNNFEPIDYKDLRLPLPKFPDENFLKTIDSFYQNDARLRDSDGWDQTFLVAYRTQKEATKHPSS